MNLPTRLVLTVISCALLLIACSPDFETPTGSIVEESNSLNMSGARDSLHGVQPIVLALASAMADRELRARLFNDLRDSPFPKHKLHLQSYLRGASGGHLLTAGAKGSGHSRDALLRRLEALPNLELLVPNELDRLHWAGTADVVVVGTAKSGPELLRGGSKQAPPGFTVSGRKVPIPLFERAPVPLIAIRPARTEFGDNPEQRRKAAPAKQRQTISTQEDEFTAFVGEDCGPDVIIECDQGGDGDGRTDGQELPSGYTHECFTSPSAPGNADADEVLDLCEHELAYAFRPHLSLATEEDEDLRREEYWAVKRHDSFSVKIFYAFGWYYDGGSATGNIKNHIGDSEWILLEVDYRNGRWAVVKGKLSAHWNAGWPWESTETYSYDEFAYSSGSARTRPLVWVAEDKHANYNGSNSCDRGAAFADNCDWNDWSTGDGFYEFHVESDANIGQSWGILKNCVFSRGSSIQFTGPTFPVDGSRQECFWAPGNKFQGWLSTAWDVDKGDPYETALDAHGF